MDTCRDSTNYLPPNIGKKTKQNSIHLCTLKCQECLCMTEPKALSWSTPNVESFESVVLFLSPNTSCSKTHSGCSNKLITTKYSLSEFTVQEANFAHLLFTRSSSPTIASHLSCNYSSWPVSGRELVSTKVKATLVQNKLTRTQKPVHWCTLTAHFVGLLYPRVEWQCAALHWCGCILLLPE